MAQTVTHHEPNRGHEHTHEATIACVSGPDTIEITVTRPRTALNLAYGWFMWMPGAVFLTAAVWFLVTAEGLSASRAVMLFALGVVPATLLYGCLAVMAVSGWASKQRVRIRDGVIRKQYPMGPFESFSLPVWAPLDDLALYSAVVEHHYRDGRSQQNRPGFHDRVSVMRRGHKVLTLGPGLTAEEGERIAAALNAFFDRSVDAASSHESPASETAPASHATES